ncbi:unnamed protein product, partial [Meganyctiphanes norvegica]
PKEICWHWQNRKCRYSTNCKKEHPEQCKDMLEAGLCKDSRCKLMHQKICRNLFFKKYCPRGDACWFVHPTSIKNDTQNNQHIQNTHNNLNNGENNNNNRNNRNNNTGQNYQYQNMSFPKEYSNGNGNRSFFRTTLPDSKQLDARNKSEPTNGANNAEYDGENHKNGKQNAKLRNGKTNIQLPIKEMPWKIIYQ